MKSISRLKDQARAHEQRENWPAAIEAYQKVLSALDDTDPELDLSLYNRIGDLYYRVGQPDRAVHYYSQAAQKYAELGLYNNAIALCNKALRYRPNEANLFRMLGEFSAEQGFFVEARRWYLQYAERLVKTGKVEQAFTALEEFASLADDPGVRETLADQFLAHGREKEALQQLERAYQERIARGEMAAAEALVTRIRDLDPSADLEALANEGRASSVEEADSAAEDDNLVIETSAGAAGFRAEGEEAEDGGSVEKLSGLEARPDDVASAPEADDAVSGLEVGFGGQAAAAPERQGGLAGMETFDAATAGGGEVPVEDAAARSEEAPADEASGVDADAMAEGVPMETTEASAEEKALAGEEESAEEEEENGLDLKASPSVEAEVDAAAEEGSAVGEGAGAEDGAGAWSAFGAETPEPQEPEFDGDVEDEEPEPLPLLDLGESVELEQEAVGASPNADERSVEPLEEQRPSVWPRDAEVVEPEPAGETPPPVELVEPAEGDEAAEQSPLLDLGKDILLPDIEPAPTPEEEALAGFDPAAFDRGLARAADAADAGSDVDAGAVLGRARELVSRELHEQALEELHLLLAPRLDRRVYENALRVADELVRRNPDDFRALQRRVEFASRLSDERLLTETYADLADYIMRRGAEAKAAMLYRRVLELDPENEAARKVLGLGAPEGDAYVDLAAFLDEEGLAAPLATGEANAQVEDFADLFAQFKAKVTEDVAVEESGSHYDLGLAFKEMGLIDEAIAEFQTALRGGEERLKVYEELGQCFMLKEQYNVAVKILARALELPRQDPRELLGVYYHLGMCHEELGDRTAARQAYDNIMVIDPSFSDVPERLSRL